MDRNWISKTIYPVRSKKNYFDKVVYNLDSKVILQDNVILPCSYKGCAFVNKGHQHVVTCNQKIKKKIYSRSYSLKALNIKKVIIFYRKKLYQVLLKVSRNLLMYDKSVLTYEHGGMIEKEIQAFFLRFLFTWPNISFYI